MIGSPNCRKLLEPMLARDRLCKVEGCWVSSLSGYSSDWTPSVSFGGRYDPGQPIQLNRQSPGAAGYRPRQRQRKSQILATIRRILTEEGLEAVTVRRIAAGSGL